MLRLSYERYWRVRDIGALIAVVLAGTACGFKPAHLVWDPQARDGDADFLADAAPADAAGDMAGDGSFAGDSGAPGDFGGDGPSPGDGVSDFGDTFTLPPTQCVVTSVSDAGAGSFRDCVILANNEPTVETIEFNIPGDPTHVISIPGPPDSVVSWWSIVLDQPLPAITSAAAVLSIDGGTQDDAGSPWAQTPPSIEIVSPGIGTDAGLHYRGSGDFTLNAVSLVGAGGPGLALSGPYTGAFVTGCHVGVDPTGENATGNGGHGISATEGSTSIAPTVVIGGEFPGAGNLVGGNDQDGIHTRGQQRLTVSGNWVGINAAGTALGNGITGIESQTPSGVIGGVNAAAGNQVAYNQLRGINLAAGAHGTSVLNNIVHHNGASGIHSRAADCIIAKNITYSDATMYTFDEIVLWHGNSALHNTIIKAPGDGVSVEGGNVTVRNNIIVGHGGYGITIDQQGDPATLEVLGNIITDNGTAPANLSGQALTGINLGMSNSSIPPLFKDWLNDDYTPIGCRSPWINAVPSALNTTLDLNGPLVGNYNAFKADIGAIETLCDQGEPLSTLVESFDLVGSDWGEWSPDSTPGCTVTPRTGAVEMTAVFGMSESCAVQTHGRYALVDSTLVVSFGSMPPLPVGASIWIELTEAGQGVLRVTITNGNMQINVSALSSSSGSSATTTPLGVAPQSVSIAEAGGAVTVSLVQEDAIAATIGADLSFLPLKHAMLKIVWATGKTTPGGTTFVLDGIN